MAIRIIGFGRCSEYSFDPSRGRFGTEQEWVDLCELGGAVRKMPSVLAALTQHFRNQIEETWNDMNQALASRKGKSWRLL